MITSVEELISKVREDYADWNTKTLPWFRGEPSDTPSPLLPKLYRSENINLDENQLLQQFRRRAPSFGVNNTPPRRNTDQWLFLAQHVGLPTRLLDWSEGLFVGLYFALLEEKPVIWMLDPVGLNRLSVTVEDIEDNVFPLTWIDEERGPVQKIDIFLLAKFLKLGKEDFVNEFPELEEHYLITGPDHNIGNLNIRSAWEKDRSGTDLPIAVRPTYVHIRMNVQRSCFTIHGDRHLSINELIDPLILKKYVIDPASVSQIKKDLKILGITNTSVFPDLDNLSKDLVEFFED